MSSSTIITPTPTSTSNNNGIINPKTNRPLFKNIKNSNVPTTPNNSLKKNSLGAIGNGPTTNVNNSNKKINNNVNGQNNILFTPKTSMVSKTATQVTRRQDEYLDIASIEKDLKRMEVFTGGISPSASPLKESSPIAIVDLESVVDPINLTTSSVSKPSVKYSVDLLLSFKSANIKRPIEIDIVENHQKEIVVPVSLPTTPYHYNNNNNNNSLHNTANGQKYPIFSPQISPFKIAYTQSSSSSTLKNITPTKKSNSTITTPQSNTHHNNNHNNVKSSHKKQNPIPFSLNTATPNQKTPNKKSTSTPKSNKKVNNNNDITTALNNAAQTTESGESDSVVPQITEGTSTTETPKKVVLKETDPKRLAARQRQIDIGKMTAGYKNYIALVPKSKRKPTDPKTPNKNQVCSKRSWDGQIKKWRRQLHLNYDWTGIPLPAEFENNDSDDTTLEIKELDESLVVSAVEN